MRRVRVRTQPGYWVLIGKGVLSELVDEYKKRFAPRLPIVISNQTVFSLWGKDLMSTLKQIGWKDDYLILVPDSEEAKSLRIFSEVINRVARLDREKKSVVIISFGGGVVGDLAGFVAGTYRRGVPLIHIPTTLLAQIDSSVGGKTAVNLDSGKNMVGVYHQPSLVLIDRRFLTTLGREQIKEGMAEGIKYGVIRSPNLFSYLEQREIERFNWDWFVEECVKIKARVVEVDEKEVKGLRFILNFGHTIGHALEIESEHRLSHGKAVAIGMIASTYIAVKRGICSVRTLDRIRHVIEKFGLPTGVGYNVDRDNFLRFLVRDKKFSQGRYRFVLPRRIGSVVIVDDIGTDEVMWAMEQIGIEGGSNGSESV